MTPSPEDCHVIYGRTPKPKNINMFYLFYKVCNCEFFSPELVHKLTELKFFLQLSMIQSKKRYEVLDCLTSLVNAYGIFFKEGSDLFVQVEPETKAITKDIGEMKRLSAVLEKHLEKRHALVSPDGQVVGEQPPSGSQVASGPPRLEGYLFKRGQNAFRTWNRRWFYLEVRFISDSIAFA